MKVLVIIMVLLLIAAIWVIFHQNERSDVQNLLLQRIKDLEKENDSLKRQVECLCKKSQPKPADKGFQGH